MREKLCGALVPAYLASLDRSSHHSRDGRPSSWRAGAASPAADLLSTFVNYTQAVFFGEQGNSCQSYWREHWKDLSIGNADRSWGWQTYVLPSPPPPPPPYRSPVFSLLLPLTALPRCAVSQVH